MAQIRFKGCPKIPPEVVGAIAESFLPFIERGDRAASMARFQSVLERAGQGEKALLEALKRAYELERASSLDPHPVLKRSR